MRRQLDWHKLRQEEHSMSKFTTALFGGIAFVLVSAGTFAPLPASAAPTSDADKAAMKKATADCKAQVKEQAKFQEMSWWARHKAVKKCVTDTLAAH
jgi:hypothetical protein